MDVELRDLRWAVVASQHRSLRQAAQVLNVRKSTLSRRLRFIEGRLGAELFLRSNGGTHVTVAGLEFLDRARRILEDTSIAFRKLKARKSRRSRPVDAWCLCLTDYGEHAGHLGGASSALSGGGRPYRRRRP